MKYPKLWDGPNPVGEALVRALQRTGSPFLSAETADGTTAGTMLSRSEVKGGEVWPTVVAFLDKHLARTKQKIRSGKVTSAEDVGEYLYNHLSFWPGISPVNIGGKIAVSRGEAVSTNIAKVTFYLEDETYPYPDLAEPIVLNDTAYPAGFSTGGVVVNTFGSQQDRLGSKTACRISGAFFLFETAIFYERKTNDTQVVAARVYKFDAATKQITHSTPFSITVPDITGSTSNSDHRCRLFRASPTELLLAVFVQKNATTYLVRSSDNGATWGAQTSSAFKSPPSFCVLKDGSILACDVLNGDIYRAPSFSESFALLTTAPAAEQFVVHRGKPYLWGETSTVADMIRTWHTPIYSPLDPIVPIDWTFEEMTAEWAGINALGDPTELLSTNRVPRIIAADRDVLARLESRWPNGVQDGWYISMSRTGGKTWKPIYRLCDHTINSDYVNVGAGAMIPFRLASGKVSPIDPAQPWRCDDRYPLPWEA